MSEGHNPQTGEHEFDEELHSIDKRRLHDDDTLRIPKSWFTAIASLLTAGVIFVSMTIYVSGKAEKKDLEGLHAKVLQMEGTLREMRAQYTTEFTSVQRDLGRISRNVNEMKTILVKYVRKNPKEE